MNITYRTTADLVAAHPTLHTTAIRFRITRLLEGNAAAMREAGPLAKLIPLWTRLQNEELRALHAIRRAEDRRVSVHRRVLRSARRRAAAACPLPLDLHAYAMALKV